MQRLGEKIPLNGCLLREVVLKGDAQAVQLLLESDYTIVNSQDNDGVTVLMSASEEGHTHIVRMLLGCPQIDVKLQDKCGWTALMYATSKNHADAVMLLLAHEDSDMFMMSLQRNRALRSASEKGYTEIVQMLLTCPGTDANIPNMHGRTALMYAAQSDRIDTVRALLASPNIDINFLDQGGRTVLDMAGNEDIMTLLMDKANTLTSSILAPAAAVPSVAVPSTIPTASHCWLTAHLVNSGYDATTDAVKDCAEKLVRQEGFVSESDFAECSTGEFNREYLVRVGVSGLGLHKHLVKLHGELHALHNHKTAPGSPMYIPLTAESTQEHSPGKNFSLGEKVIYPTESAAASDGTAGRKRDRAEASIAGRAVDHEFVPAHGGLHK